LRVNILRRLPRLTGIPVLCPSAAEAQVRAVTIDLDRVPPRVKYASPGGAPFGFTVAKGETETFNVIASATKARYRWLIDLDIVVSGHKRTLRIDEGGEPFETTAAPHRGWWTWNYRDAWSLTTHSGSGSSREVPAATPLPPLR
jgi:hypothetical protein